MRRARVLVFAGSTRTESVNRKLAQAAAAHLQRDGLETTFVDLREYPMPLYDGDVENDLGTPDTVLAFQRLVREHDALVIASPEYNGSFSALVKNAVDWISRPAPGERPLAAFRGKLAAVMSASPGRGGGQRGLRHLRELLEMIGVSVISSQVSVAAADKAFDSDGRLVRPEDEVGLQQMSAELQSALASAATEPVTATGTHPGTRPARKFM